MRGNISRIVFCVVRGVRKVSGRGFSGRWVGRTGSWGRVRWGGWSRGVGFVRGIFWGLVFFIGSGFWKRGWVGGGLV